jgi:pimeloyl-ACP methyl ester carboxylesterase
LFATLQRAAMRRRGFRSRMIPCSFGRIHAYEGRGRGPLPIGVFLHGFSASGAQFGQLMSRLTSVFQRLVAIDLPAHGLSEIPRRRVDYFALKDGLVEAMDVLLPFGAQASLIGNSMGGFAALRYANFRPERVQSLVLVSPGGAAMAPQELDQLRSLFEMERMADALDFLDRLFAKKPPLRKLVARFLMKHMGKPEFRSLIASLDTSILLQPDELQGLQPPTLLVWGEQDDVLPAASRDFFLAHLPGHAVIRRPADFGHSPQLEHPAALGRLVVEFLESLQTRTLKPASAKAGPGSFALEAREEPPTPGKALG